MQTEHVICCDMHVDGPAGSCCDPDDCGPCCPDCPTCPSINRMHTVPPLARSTDRVRPARR